MRTKNFAKQIEKHWSTHRQEIEMVWYLLPASNALKTSVTAADLQNQIADYLLMTPFHPEAGRRVGEQLAQAFELSLEKLGYLQRLLAEQLFLGLDEAQTAWLAQRLPLFWAEMTVGYSNKLHKMYVSKEVVLEKMLSTSQQDAEQERHFEALFNDTYSPVVIHENGRIIAINKAVTQVYGYLASDLIGQTIQVLVHAMAPSSEQSNILKNMSVGHHHKYQTSCIHKNGSEIAMEVTASPIIYNGRRMRMIVLRPLTAVGKSLPDVEEANLSPRQQQVLHYLALGLADKEIAATLQITVSTVKHHKQKIFKKLKVSNRSEAVVWAWQKSNLFSALSSE
ncbi:LuxR C-terminal-related transcriptional regulator [Candidatus Leptofilum sp.]|uniref:LuxR C-terminal-related transcriptional regulator n=1 Tax=Candidatus Leptofilum sp. TaxID=3241576 RepID=UPI003B5B1FD2